MKAYILSCGYIIEKRSDLLHDFGTDGSIKLPIISVLFKCEGHNILFDTGMYNKNSPWNDSGVINDPNEPIYMSSAERIENQLALCELKPKDIDIVILSHLHYDHVGGLDLFKHTKVYIPKTNHPFMQKMNGYNYEIIDMDIELLPGLKLIQFPGHTDGLIGILAEFKEGNIIFCQDAVHVAENFNTPINYPPEENCDSIDNYLASIEKLRKLSEKYNAQIVFGHDIEQFGALKIAPLYYE